MFNKDRKIPSVRLDESALTCMSLKIRIQIKSDNIIANLDTSANS
jgi:hypothetical protein